MRRAAILMVPLMVLLLCKTGSGDEKTGKLERRIEALEEDTDALRKQLRTYEEDEETLRVITAMLETIEERIGELKEEIEAHESHEDCVSSKEGGNWEQFFNDLDRHNGDETL